MQKLVTVLLTLLLIGCNSLTDSEDSALVKSKLNKLNLEENLKKENSGNDLSKDNLFGKVESVHSVYYEANLKSSKIKEDNKTLETRVFYNEKGNKSKEEFYDKNGVLEKERIYKYNLLDNEVEISTYNKAGSLVLKVDEKINENGDLTERSTFEEGRLIIKGIYTYTDNGREVTFDYYGEDGKVTEIYSHKNYINEDKIERNNQNSEWELIDKFKFKEEDNLIEGIHWDIDRNINHYSTSKNYQANTMYYRYNYIGSGEGWDYEVHVDFPFTSEYKTVREDNWREGTILKTKSGETLSERMVINRTIEYYSK